MNESDPAKIPLLFPDPVIEFYLERVDRAAIRKQLEKTPTERLQTLMGKAESHEKSRQLRVREEPKNSVRTGSENVKPFAGFMNYVPHPDPADIPLLYPDPVVEAYLKDVDRGLIREQLKKTPSQRLDDLIAMAEFYEEGRKARMAERNNEGPARR